jgi:polysaccharide pyruvyl transferase WcaK-like protein
VSEFADTCNMLIKQGYTLEFVPMGLGDVDDRRYAAIIHSRITKKEKAVWHLAPFNHSQFERAIAESEFVISQRFHGIVFSIKYGVPFVCIRAADKFTTLMQDMGAHSHLDYYGFTKTAFFNAMDNADISLAQKFYMSSVAAFQSVQKTVLEIFR